MRFYLALEKSLHYLRNVCFIVPVEDFLFILTYLNYTHLILLENIIAKPVYFRGKVAEILNISTFKVSFFN